MSTLPSPLPISTDLPCLHCHYNLRTRLPTDLCPECGHPIQPSIDAHTLWSAFPRKKTAILAFILLALSFLANLIVISAHFFFIQTLTVVLVFEILWIFTLSAALFLFPFSFRFQNLKSLNRTLLITALLSLVPVLLDILYVAFVRLPPHPIFLWPPALNILLSIVFPALMVFIDILLIMWLVRLTRHLNAPRLRAVTVILFFLIICLKILSTGQNTYALLFNFHLIGDPSPAVYVILVTLNCLQIALDLALFIYSLAFIKTLHTTFSSHNPITLPPQSSTASPQP